MPSSQSSLFAFCSLAVLYLYFVPPRSPTWLPFPICKQTHLTAESLSIGISLTASYGTVSIRRSDGSFTDIGRVDGDQIYVDMMRRFSLLSSEHPAYVFPYYFSKEIGD
jgi:hypothetical protein